MTSVRRRIYHLIFDSDMPAAKGFDLVLIFVILVSVVWVILESITLTTVGFGEVTPLTTFGRFIASFVMIMGYGIIAVPTGIVTFEIASSIKAVCDKRVCGNCGHGSHDADANYCKSCGEIL